MNKQKVGIDGCNITSEIYVELVQHTRNIDIVACADDNLTKAINMKDKYGIPKVMTRSKLYNDQKIDYIIKL
ncbi:MULTISPECIES: hypothetical protein [Mammaliicoccus]|uniref:NYN domain-containing protein n=1 Tax=Mammaliicoccus fleurettii TaxID=150056 RepID=A0ABS5MLP6_9STAP|nr:MULTISPECIES: hypothetical protein [Mammaliicoccus]HCN60185.1 hypothetical protein [Staphylococcus sp.]MBL0847197.1 hypothetical protein [Mammaliicoccus fleurettii]MBO3062123.1 hypothetical protein [Mammaliicoccus fleurettii]MBS3671808.1 hypothetical protein [Mammaliicoccus fleurettii]MBS3696835.1 hypothetical protein [Mammaliicoccus fleurettii]